MSLGVTPAASLGHSIGEFVSACIAEVFSLEDALRAVAARGRLMQSMPTGSMLAVMAPAAQIEPLLPPSISIAAINTPTACVASGPTDDIAALEKKLQAEGISSTPLHTSHAFHSGMMDAAVPQFVEIMRGITLSPPQLAYVSNVTGDWITDEQATDPAYWGQHLRAAVQFHKGLSTIHDQMPGIFLEVGPGRNLTTLTKSLVGDAAGTVIHSSLPHASARGVGEVKTMLRTCAELWLAGVPIDWTRRYEGERRIKRVLPTYPFERRRYWIVEEQQRLRPPRGPVAALRPGAQSGLGAGRPRSCKLSHGDSHLAAGAIFRSVQAELQAQRAALAGVQSHRKDRQTDRGGVARARRQGHRHREGREIQNVRRRAYCA